MKKLLFALFLFSGTAQALEVESRNAAALTGTVNLDSGTIDDLTSNRLTVVAEINVPDFSLDPTDLAGGATGYLQNQTASKQAASTNHSSSTVDFMHVNTTLTIAVRGDCESIVPNQIGQFCVQNSGATPLWIATGTTAGSFSPVVMASATAVLSSVTVGGSDGEISLSTNGVLSSSRQCPFGFTREGAACSDSDGVPHLLIVSSAVLSGGSGSAFVTYDIPALSTAIASAIEIEVECDVTNNAGAGDSFIAPNARVTGGGGSGPGSSATRKPGICNQSVASENNYCQAVFPMRLGTGQDIDLAVELIGATSGTCVFYVIKVWD